MTANFCKVVRENLEKKVARSYEEAELQEYHIRELAYLLEDLSANVPLPDVDTSFSGYNLADDALLEWQRTGRAEEKAAKEKRKQEKEKRKREEAEGGGRKKAKP